MASAAEVRIPSTIWMLWLQGEAQAPWLVQRCIASWREQNPSWQVRVLSDQDLPLLQPTGLSTERWKQLSMQKQSNLARVHLLLNHGGVWADATTLCRRPLDTWIEQHSPTGFFAFSRPGADRLLSNWFLAATQGHPLCQAWLDEQITYFKHQQPIGTRTPLQRAIFRGLEGIGRLNILSSQLWFLPGIGRLTGHVEPYFISHYCFARCLDKQPKLQRLWQGVPAVDAQEAHIAKRACQRQLPPIEQQQQLGLLLSSSTPVFKLSWKTLQGSDTDRNLVSALLRASSQT
jgi:hypothetical protein